MEYSSGESQIDQGGIFLSKLVKRYNYASAGIAFQSRRKNGVQKYVLFSGEAESLKWQINLKSALSSKTNKQDMCDTSVELNYALG